MTFRQWLKVEWKRLSLPLGLLVTLYGTYKGSYSYLEKVWPLLGSSFVMPALNAGVALVALFFRPCGPRLHKIETDKLSEGLAFPEAALRIALGVRSGEKWDTRAQQADEAVTQFIRCWTGLWFTWAVQYMLLAVWLSPLAADLHSGVAPRIFEFLEAAAYTASTLMLLLCFLAMWAVTVNERGEPDFRIAPYVGVAAILVLIQAIAPATSWAPVLLDKIEGIVSGVVLAMFVGRLENKYLGTPIFVVVSLYIYAVIQPLHFLTLDDGQPLERDVILGAAFFLKIPLLLVVAWLLDTGKFLFYMARVRSIHIHVGEDWEAFRQIVGKQ